MYTKDCIGARGNNMLFLMSFYGIIFLNLQTSVSSILRNFPAATLHQVV